MTTQTTTVQRYRRPKGQYPRRQETERRPKPLPEYLEAHEVDALIRAAPNARARLLFLVQWRAGLRVSEALALEVRDLSLDSGLPTIHVRQGKGAKPRIVPVHPELHSALASSLQFGNIIQGDRLIRASRSTADRWIRAAKTKAEEAGAIPAGQRISSHTLRHSYARHLLMHGVPINYLSYWASIAAALAVSALAIAIILPVFKSILEWIFGATRSFLWVCLNGMRRFIWNLRVWNWRRKSRE